jgi:death-on-curing protein
LTEIPELAAAYTAGIVRNHPFVDGNKRTGFLAGAAFLELNGLRLTATEPEATQIILGLAAGVYQIGEDQARSWIEVGTISSGSTPFSLRLPIG